MDELRRIRNKNKPKKKFKINKILVVIVIFLSTLIMLKNNPDYQKKFYKYVFEDNISFAYINKLYNKYFGSILPKKNVEQVFNETLKYSSSNSYLEGVSLDVGLNYLVPNKSNGIVIFVGEKEGYGNTVIIQQSDGVDVWYSNLKEVNISLYDYINKGELIGMCDNNLYLVFKKDGVVLNYNEHI